MFSCSKLQKPGKASEDTSFQGALRYPALKILFFSLEIQGFSQRDFQW